MLVSAISMCEPVGTCNQQFGVYGKQLEQIGDTAFNSLTPYSPKQITPEEKLPKLFADINQWEYFCNSRVVGQKLNIIA